MSAEAVTRRYHPLVVVLHWLVALLIIGNLAVGALVLSEMSNADPGKAGVLRLHMLSGITILVLMVVRLISRLFTKVPPIPHEKGGLRWLARINHWGLYLVIFAMLSTGLGMAQQSGIFPLLGGEPVALPTSFEQFQPHAGHELFAIVLMALIALHLAGVAYHYLAKKENILSRMWFGRRDADDVPAGEPSAATERQG